MECSGAAGNALGCCWLSGVTIVLVSRAGVRTGSVGNGSAQTSTLMQWTDNRWWCFRRGATLHEAVFTDYGASADIFRLAVDAGGLKEREEV